MKKTIAAAACATISVIAIAATPIDTNSVIFPEFKSSPERLEALVRLVKAHGYRCDSVSVAKTMAWGNGFVLICNRTRYEYEIEDKGGRWQVTVK